MKINIEDSEFDRNGRVFDIQAKKADITVTGSKFRDNEELGNLHLGEDSEFNFKKNILTDNQKGFTIREYNEKLVLIEQFVNSNLDKLNSNDAKKLQQLLKTANGTENIEEKKSVIGEIYDIAKNGIAVPLATEGMKKLFQCLSTINL